MSFVFCLSYLLQKWKLNVKENNFLLCPVNWTWGVKSVVSLPPSPRTPSGTRRIIYTQLLINNMVYNFNLKYLQHKIIMNMQIGKLSIILTLHLSLKNVLNI